MKPLASGGRGRNAGPERRSGTTVMLQAPNHSQPRGRANEPEASPHQSRRPLRRRTFAFGSWAGQRDVARCQKWPQVSSSIDTTLISRLRTGGLAFQRPSQRGAV
ncbi:hypothetical protein GGTG_01529 [Gaeumannomyces tritici R3-111a-1]|uniref:Uncharacterized protein n=1 Tax=Gaeumannomyces tritici (strain R3-111a-1) TaxID=644352 RepID=J3NJU8_GAET3|nr:hypothetical protein GGTG_01529 [Gaeumannomyces tritici R3-111a-1]EJT81551.1 hypothetical protein GGTG_01529 [Gaeumannomyces tritici R3-111a-1]